MKVLYVENSSKFWKELSFIEQVSSGEINNRSSYYEFVIAETIDDIKAQLRAIHVTQLSVILAKDGTKHRQKFLNQIRCLSKQPDRVVFESDVENSAGKNKTI